KNPREPFIFNFNSKLNITSNPPGATIRINGVQLSSTTPTDVNWEISEEPIEIQLTKAGFPDLKGFSINPEDGSEIIPDRRFWKFSRNDNIKDDFNIEGIFHKFVDIKSVPSRAQIIINNSPVGTTGINGKVALTRGTHQLVLQKRGYLTKKRTITIDEATSDQLTEVLSRRVKLTVQNAATNDGTDIGAHIVSLRSNGKTSRINRTTPTNLTLLPYTYAAFLKKQGFQDKEIVIGRNQVNVEVTMDPVPAPVEIYIVDSITNQAIDQVEISYKLQETTEPEKSMGTANTQGELFVEIPPGMYQITVNKPGYQPVTKNLRVKSGRRNRLTFRIVTQ
ncbi:MAG: PEGA domain-containing protein, partial [Calditrichaeota bacterium]